MTQPTNREDENEMAEKMKSNGAESSLGATKGHNIQARGAAIREAFEDLYRLDSEIAAAEDKHVEPSKKARTKRWRTIKKDVDIPRKVLELDYKKFKMRKRAEDDDDGDTLDHMREVSLALNPDGQYDWASGVEAEGEDLGSKPAKAKAKKAKAKKAAKVSRGVKAEGAPA